MGFNQLMLKLEISSVIDTPPASSCTSCTYSEDFSNYWTASIYYKARNGSFKRVPQFANLGLGVQGGMTIYYTQFDFFRDNVQQQPITAFPPVSMNPQSL